MIVNPQNKLSISIVTVVPSTQQVTSTGLTNLSSGGWHYVSAVWKENIALEVFVDGILDGSTAASGKNTLRSIGSLFYLGAGENGGLKYFNGSIDEARIYNRSLSASEIYELYASNLQKFNSSYWEFYVNQSQNATTGLADGNYTYEAISINSSGGLQTTGIRNVIINSSFLGSPSDTTYPQFSNYWDNNATLTNSGTGNFNVTLFNTNGTVLLEINGTNVTATNLSSNVYNVSYNFTTNGVYQYKWHSWGNGTSELYNVSETKNYVVNYSCVQNLQNTSWTGWVNYEGCRIDDEVGQSRNLTQYDANSCGIYENETFFEYQETSCNYCSYSLANTSFGEWSNLECVSNERNQTRNLTQYDENYTTCYAITGLPSDYYANQTFLEYQLVGPTYQNTSWTGWIEITECRANDTVVQERNLTQYDLYGCGSNSTYYSYQEVPCDYCTPSMQNTSWTDWQDDGVCLINDTKIQNRSLIEYDENNCEEILNTTYWEYQNVSCNYCSYNVANTSSEWTNITCLGDNTMNQTRNNTEYDYNYGNCYAVTNISSDLWNEGNNNTYFEFRNILSCGISTPVTPSGGGGGGGGGSRNIITPNVTLKCTNDSNCSENYTCFGNKCVKLFDVEILSIGSPLHSSKSFQLDYFIKGMAEFEGDVIIKFWVQNESTKIEIGHDTIYFGAFEGKNKSTTLYFPSNLYSGDYNVYVEANFENYKADSFRRISIVSSIGENEIETFEESSSSKIPSKAKWDFKSFFGGVFDSMKENKFLLTLLSLIIIILVASFVIVRIFLKYREKSRDAIDRLNILNRLKKQKEINPEEYHLKRNIFKNIQFNNLKAILKSEVIWLIVLLVVAVLGILLLSIVNLTGSVIGNAQEKPQWFLLVIFFIVLFGFVIINSKNIFLKKFPSKTKKNYLGNLMNKEVYSEKGNYLGKISNISLEDNKIGRLNIRMDEKNGYVVPGIIVNYKHVKCIGEIVILGEEIAEHMEKYLAIF
jgi:sporulation protein YlmC with PRC-barrel domain